MNLYRITIEQRPSYLYATVTGNNTVETIGRYIADIRAACVRLGVFKVLAVVHLDGPGVSMLDLYKVVAAGSDETAGAGIRAAYVELNPIRSDENMRMAENVAHTRGIQVAHVPRREGRGSMAAGWHVKSAKGHRHDRGVADGRHLACPAHMEHRFENFSDDFATWVVFYGPLGGEQP